MPAKGQSACILQHSVDVNHITNQGLPAKGQSVRILQKSVDVNPHTNQGWATEGLLACKAWQNVDLIKIPGKDRQQKCS